MELIDPPSHDCSDAVPPTFATCSYVEFDPKFGIPVRITLGNPRFKLRYPLNLNMQQAAPERAWFHAADHEFDRKYYEKLDRIGADWFRNYANQFSDGTTLVLLCFENLSKAACHRQLFAEWWQRKTGEPVPEYGAHPGTDPKPTYQKKQKAAAAKPAALF